MNSIIHEDENVNRMAVNHLRHTIYIDEDNKICTPNISQQRVRKSKMKFGNAGNMSGIVFESNGFSQRGIWDEEKLIDDNSSISEDHHAGRQKRQFKKRFKSPPVIPEKKNRLS